MTSNRRKPAIGASLLLSLSLAWVLASSAAWADGPVAAFHPIVMEGRLQPTPQDRCPVCGMFPAKQPKSAAGMILADGRSYYFCSNSCLLRTYRRPSTYLGGEAPAVVRMLVLDYFSGASIDAESAWWVAGSDVIGPMGPALVALGSRSDAAVFVQRHGGREVFQIKTTDDAMWERLLTPHRK